MMVLAQQQQQKKSGKEEEGDISELGCWSSQITVMHDEPLLPWA